MTGLRRRGFLAGAGAVALTVWARPFALAAEGAAEAVAAILDGRTAEVGGIEIEAPGTAENGAQVPITVRVDSPMTPADHVTAIHLIVPANPAPGAGRFRLTPGLARAEVFTRIRLAEAQEVLVLADLSDGRVLSAAVEIAVTTGGCAT